MAPTKTHREVFDFRGVYTKAYITSAITPSKAERGLRRYRQPMPIIPAATLQAQAAFTLIRPVGNGLLAVRVMIASVSRSKIWFKPLEAPVSKYPPTVSSNMVRRSTSSAPINQPSTADITTKKPSLNLYNVPTSFNSEGFSVDEFFTAIL